MLALRVLLRLDAREATKPVKGMDSKRFNDIYGNITQPMGQTPIGTAH